MSAIVLEPDWIVPVNQPSIRRGEIVVDSGSIEYVGPKVEHPDRSIRRMRLEGVCILPGLVNSHCHLEFSDLQHPIPAGDSFPEWIRQVIAVRRQTALTSESEQLDARKRAMILGIVECWKSGVRWVVDNVTAPWDANWIAEAERSIRHSLPPWIQETFLSSSPIYVQPCFELIDIQAARHEQTWGFARSWMDRSLPSGVHRPGLAPHAPYTASPKLAEQASQISRLEQRLISIHLAESKDELQWLKHKTGPFASTLGTFIEADYWNETRDIASYWKAIRESHRGLVIHGNYLTDDMIDSLASNSENTALVYCPRTFAHFRHKNHPIERLVEAGAHVFLGTDSRASNPDLALVKEIALAKTNHPSITNRALLNMTTQSPARFLGIETLVGTLERHRPALLSAISMERTESDPLESELDWNAVVIKPLELVVAEIEPSLIV